MTGQTGLGLHIVKKAMESYGGSVQAVDNTPRGVVFVLSFRMV
ncbi:MAG: ATP-binding protein [Deltaproteobacteria bacterium]|nr:ATP-binding protein [Deltaproteobacteria bacterium]